MADQSRWFIKEKPLEDRIKACKKSLEAAVRSQRANIAEALRAKLAKLKAEQTFASPKSGRAVAKPAERKVTAEKVRGKAERQSAATPKNGARAATAAKPAKRRVKVKKVKGKVTSASPERADYLKAQLASRADSTATIEPATLRKKSSKASKTSTAESSKHSKSKLASSEAQTSDAKTPKSSDRATAIALLLRAAKAAKAARHAAGEESEEEAPLPELPRKDFSASNGMAMTVTDVEEMESEELAEAQDEDEDFFDAVEDPLLVATEAGTNKTTSLRGAAKRAKKQRRKERLEMIREEPLLKHPSWVAQKSPRVSGAFSAVKGKKGKRTTFASDSE